MIDINEYFYCIKINVDKKQSFVLELKRAVVFTRK